MFLINDHIGTYVICYNNNGYSSYKRKYNLYIKFYSENIRFGKPSATDEEVKSAAKESNAFTFIEKFPKGFNTFVGERGIQLSGGQV